jgi:transcriptional regulator with XRE-family HTH domain
MLTLGQRVDAAIRASGKKAQQIAKTLRVNPTTISRLRKGKEINPKLQLLVGIARETGTTVVALLGGSFEISPEDVDELQRFRDWIDGKLAAIDALREPNAELLRGPVRVMSRDRQVADRPERIKTPLGIDAHLVLRAIGTSMVGDGILPDDVLYAVLHNTEDAPPAGKLVACRIAESVFVKRLILQHNRRYLLSADRRYRAIAVDEEGLACEIFGVIIGRSGRTK